MTENEDRQIEDIEMARFVKTGLGIKETLQSIEDLLIEAGYDDFVVATDRGSLSLADSGTRE